MQFVKGWRVALMVSGDDLDPGAIQKYFKVQKEKKNEE